MSEYTHKQVIVLRKDLNMRKGKMVAQGAHASMAAILSEAEKTSTTYHIPLNAAIKPWLEGKFAKIVVSVDSEAELLEIHNKARASGLIVSLIQDSGLTEFDGVPTYTAVAVGPDSVGVIDEITSHLPLL